MHACCPVVLSVTCAVLANPPATWKAIGTVLKRSARSVQLHASALRRLHLAPIAPRPPGRQARSSATSALAIAEQGEAAAQIISGTARSTLSLPTAVASDLGELVYDPSIPTAVGTEIPLPYAEMPLSHSVVASLTGSNDPPPTTVDALPGL